MDNYYNRSEVSNSLMGEIDKYFKNIDEIITLEKAFRDGNLFDAMVLEPWRCDHLRLRVDEEQYTKEEWNNSRLMMRSLRQDKQVMEILEKSDRQVNFYAHKFPVQHEGFQFLIDLRCRYDAFIKPWGWGWDLKSTAATTKEQFLAACMRFDYDRSRALYMDVSKAEKDMIVGVSKKNHKIFRISIDRNSDFYKSGKAKYQALAFKYAYLFGDYKSIQRISTI